MLSTTRSTESEPARAAHEVSCPVPDAVAQTRSRSPSPATLAAYANDIALYKKAGASIPCDAKALTCYIAKMRTRVAPKTLYRRAMAIRHAHIELGVPSPTDEPWMRPTLRALQRGQVLGKDLKPRQHDGAAVTKKTRTAAPLTRKLLAEVLQFMHKNSKDRRDAALLTLAFTAALKRAELVALNVGDVRLTTTGMSIHLRGRREGRPRVIAIDSTASEIDAVSAMRAWVEYAGIDAHPEGPCFVQHDRGSDPVIGKRLSAAFVSQIVKHRVAATGVDGSKFSGESMRIGRQAEAATGVLL